jgi:hypothetical protein
MVVVVLPGGGLMQTPKAGITALVYLVNITQQKQKQ